MNILVTGTTGNIGGKLVPRLLSAGHHVASFARQSQRLERYQWQEVEFHDGNLLDLDSIRLALQDKEVAYYLVHSMADGVQGYEQRDVLAAHNFGTAARQAGVQRIIYLGALGNCENDLTSHLASRQHIGDILRESGVPVTEFRSAVIIGPGSMSFEMIRYLMERFPVILTPRWANTRCQPIEVENVLEYLTSCLTKPHTIGKTYEIGGPDILTYASMLREYAYQRRLKRYLVPVSGLTLQHAAYIMNAFTPIPISYAIPLLGGLRSEVVVRDPSATQDFQIDLLPYPKSLQQALTRYGNGEVESYWLGRQVETSPGRTHKEIEGMVIERLRSETEADPQLVYNLFTSLGGKRGWLFAGWLWQLLGLIKQLVGGIGMRRGKRNPVDLQVGDILDGWQVEAIQAPDLMRLRLDLKSLGPAWLQFEARKRDNNRTLLILTTFFEPRGLLGLASWYVLYPFHRLILKGLSRAIIRQAESLQDNPENVQERDVELINKPNFKKS